MFRKPTTIAALCAIAASLPAPTRAQSTCTLPVAAYLTDGVGAPLIGGLDVELRFYTDGDPEALPVECRSATATLDSGWIRLLVDACGPPDAGDCGVVPLQDVFDGTDSVWVGIQTGSDPGELAPRQLVGAVPYALRSSTAALADDATLLDGHSAADFASSDELIAHLAEGHRGGAFGTPTMTVMTTGGETCALVDQRAICWPYTDYFPYRSAYVVIDISGYVVCGIDAGGALECFEVTSSGGGELEAAPPGEYMDVAVGEGVCALTTAGLPVCWGREDLAADSPIGVFSTIAVGNGGGRTACATSEVSGVVCWGGASSSGGGDIIVRAPTDGLYSDVFVGDFFACAVDAVESTLDCWGTSVSPPGGTFLSVSGGDHGACGLTTDRRVSCWVNDERGTWSWENANVPTGDGFVDVTAEGDRGCAIHESGEVYCWAARGRTPINTEVPFGLRYR